MLWMTQQGAGMACPNLWKEWRKPGIIAALLPNAMPGMVNLQTIESESIMMRTIFDAITQYNQGCVSNNRINPLAIMLFTRSSIGLKLVVGQFNFIKLSQMLTQIVTTFPKMAVDELFLSSLVGISPSHYKCSALQGERELGSVAKQDKRILLSYFDAVDEVTKKRVADRCKISSQQIRKGLCDLINRFDEYVKLEGRGYAFTEEWRVQSKQLDVIIHNLQIKHDDQGHPMYNPAQLGEFWKRDVHDTLSDIEVQILMELGSAEMSGMCAIKDAINKAISLLNNSMPSFALKSYMRPLFEKQRLSAFNTLCRSLCLEEHVAKPIRSNFLHHLQVTRGIPGERSIRNLKSCFYDQNSPIQLGKDRHFIINDFDLRYTTNIVVNSVSTCLRQPNARGRKYRDWCRACLLNELAPRAALPCPNKGNLRDVCAAAVKQYKMGQFVTYEELQTFFKQYDKNYQVPRESVSSCDDFLFQCRRHSWLIPLTHLVSICEHVGAFLLIDGEQIKEGLMRCAEQIVTIPAQHANITVGAFMQRPEFITLYNQIGGKMCQTLDRLTDQWLNSSAFKRAWVSCVFDVVSCNPPQPFGHYLRCFQQDILLQHIFPMKGEGEQKKFVYENNGGFNTMFLVQMLVESKDLTYHISGFAQDVFRGKSTMWVVKL